MRLKPFNLTLALLLLLTANSHATEPRQNAPEKSAQLSEAMALMDPMQKMAEADLARLDGDNEKMNEMLSKAVAELDVLLEKNPNSVVALNTRGLAKNMQQPNSGKTDLEKSIEISSAKIAAQPNDARAYYDRAAAYRKLDKYAEAEADYLEAIKLAPEKAHWPLELRAMKAEAGLK